MARPTTAIPMIVVMARRVSQPAVDVTSEYSRKLLRLVANRCAGRVGDASAGAHRKGPEPQVGQQAEPVGRHGAIAAQQPQFRPSAHPVGEQLALSRYQQVRVVDLGE
jgi:hypothetical protein